jgi:hypothetical protein
MFTGYKEIKKEKWTKEKKKKRRRKKENERGKIIIQFKIIIIEFLFNKNFKSHVIF